MGVLVEEGEEAGDEAEEGVEGPVVAPEGSVLVVFGEGLVGELEGAEGGQREVDQARQHSIELYTQVSS